MERRSLPCRGARSRHGRYDAPPDAAWLGVEIDREANERGGPRLSAQHSRVAAFVIPTNEELMIARHTRRLIGDQ